MSKIFLGGTCNESIWRKELIPELEKRGLDYFNPVVDDWNEEAQKEEERQKEVCDVHLYVITSEMTGVFSIAEAVASANMDKKFSLLVVLKEGFSESQLRSLYATVSLMNRQKNGAGLLVNLGVNWVGVNWEEICAITLDGGTVAGKKIEARPLTYLEAMVKMADRNMDIRLTNTLTEARKVKAGGLLTFGIDANSFQLVANDMMSAMGGEEGSYVTVAMVINNQQMKEIQEL
jgi:hypothetical protein